MSTLTCRFYRNRYPKEEDLVRVQVTNVTDLGAYVQLLEYNKIEGFIQLGEISRLRLRSISKALRGGNISTVLVIRVDLSKNYIDLSKKRVSQEETETSKKRFSKAKLVNSIVQYVGELCQMKTIEELEDLMERTVWTLNDTYKGGSYEAFKQCIVDPSALDQCKLTENEKSHLIKCIKHRMEPKKKKVKAEIRVCCYTCEGVESVRTALVAGMELGDGENKFVKVALISPPKYTVTVVMVDKNEALKLIKDVMKRIEDKITELKGFFDISSQPVFVAEQDLGVTDEENDENISDDDDADNDEDVYASIDEDEEEENNDEEEDNP